MLSIDPNSCYNVLRQTRAGRVDPPTQEPQERCTLMASSDTAPVPDCSNLLIVLPNWVGDVVMATPSLRAIRRQVRGQITYLMRPYVQDVVHGLPWMDHAEFWPESAGRKRAGFLPLARRLRARRFSAVLLLTNSFRSAVLAWTTAARRRIGYARDYRSFLLTDPLRPRRREGRFKIESMLTYYGRLAQHLGCGDVGGRLELATDPDSDAAVDRWWSELGVKAGQPLIVLNPGGSFGASKLYPAERFAEVGEALARDIGARILVTGGPQEVGIVEAVVRGISNAAALLPPRLNLRLLKSIIRRSRLLVTNDTGPRHFAIAFDVPVVTIFGPTHPAWTESHYRDERKVQIPVNCGPCQKPVCPLDHRCMTGIAPAAVVAQAMALLAGRN